MKLTGQKLREKREQVRLTIGEVSLATKINPKVLCAMEAGDILHLPAKTFLRGFVRSYAGYLKMNVDEVLALFNEETGEVAKELSEPAVQEANDHSNHKTKAELNGEGSNTLRMIIVGGILILIVMIIGVRALIQKYERERAIESSADLAASKVVPLEKKADEKPPESAAAVPTGESASPAAVVAQKSDSFLSGVALTPLKPEPKIAPVPEKDSIAAPTVDKTSKVAESAKVTLPDPEPKPASAPAEPKVDSKAEAAAKTKADGEAKIAKAKAEDEAKAAKAKASASSETESKEATSPPEKAKPVSGKGHHEIILEALDKVDVKFELNGKTKKVSLAPNQVHTIVAEGPITLDLSDGGAVNITDNGHDKGPAGDLGQPKQVSIP